MSVTRDDVLALIGEAIKVDHLTADASMAKVRKWDSLSQLKVIMSLEKQLGVHIPAELFGELTSVPAICDFLADEGLLA